VAVNVAGSASTNPLTADAGSVTVDARGSVATAGRSAIAILGQSIGGGGGDGGATSGGFVSNRRQWCGGGAGANALPSCITQREHARRWLARIVMQSIGGAAAMRGTCRTGSACSRRLRSAGAAGKRRQWRGSAHQPVQRQHRDAGSRRPVWSPNPIGGGGGTGGEAFTSSIGAGFSASVAVGGAGGNGGLGGQANAAMLEARSRPVGILCS